MVCPPPRTFWLWLSKYRKTFQLNKTNPREILICSCNFKSKVEVTLTAPFGNSVTILCYYKLPLIDLAKVQRGNKNTVYKNVVLLLACFTSDTFSPWLETSHDSGLAPDFYAWWEIRQNHGLTLNVILMFYTTDKSLTYGNNPLSCSIIVFRPIDSTASTLYSILNFLHCSLPIIKGFSFLFFFSFFFFFKGSIGEEKIFVPCFHPAVLLASVAAQCPLSNL